MKTLFLSSMLFLAACAGGPSTMATPPAAPPPVIMPQPPPVTPPPVTPTPPADETATLQAALDTGAVVRLDGRTYNITKSLRMTMSNSALIGTTGTVIEFHAALVGTPRQWCVNDRAIAVQCGLASTVPLPLSAGIAKGDTSFQVQNLSDAETLNPGDWVIITICDPGIADANTHLGYPTYVDWVQVASVVGTTVHTVAPFRMAFPNTLAFITNSSGLGFVKTPNVSGISLQNLTIKVDAGAPAAGIYVLGTRGTTLTNVTIVNLTSDPVYTEQSQGFTLAGCTITGGDVLSELAESVDLSITGSTFTSTNLSIGLDLGTGFFTIENNTLPQNGRVAIYALYNVHDGTITNNQIAGLTSNVSYGAVGVLLYGSPNISVTGNTITGPGGPGVGIQASGDSHAAIYEPSTGDVQSANIISGFDTPVSIR